MYLPLVQRVTTITARVALPVVSTPSTKRLLRRRVVCLDLGTAGRPIDAGRVVELLAHVSSVLGVPEQL